MIKNKKPILRADMGSPNTAGKTRRFIKDLEIVLSLSRPHQALWNYTPGFVHRTGNKSMIPSHYKRSVQIAKEQRIIDNRLRLQHK
uniref:Integrase catalytic domain-containing protein n=2 Tax=Desulfobacterium TaxID=2295 RepID=E1Y9S4_9BACT|nr:unknown protein [uncultured Desulfobacterium sp.]